MAGESGKLKVEEEATLANEEKIAENSFTRDEKQGVPSSSETSCSTSSAQEQPSTAAAQEQPSTSARIGAGVPRFDGTWYPWAFDPSTMGSNPDFAPWNGVRLDQAGIFPPMVPIMYPAQFPAYFQAPSQEEQQLRNGGIFAVPMVPVIGPVAAFPPGGLIPFTYNFPQITPLAADGTAQGAGTTAPRPSDSDRAMPAEAQEGLHRRHVPPARAGQAHRAEGQRHIVRRFHVGFQLDLLLILKLAVVVFVFNQDGSRDRLLLLLFLAGLVYLYQTGALAPLLQWISQSAQRAMMPPQQPQLGRAQPAGPDVQGQEARGNGQDENVAANAPAAEAGVAAGAAAGAAPGQDGAVAPAGGAGAGDAAGERAAPQAPQGPTWWGFFKELQMLVVGFVTSLLPGFQHVD